MRSELLKIRHRCLKQPNQSKPASSRRKGKNVCYHGGHSVGADDESWPGLLRVAPQSSPTSTTQIAIRTAGLRNLSRSSTHRLCSNRSQIPCFKASYGSDTRDEIGISQPSHGQNVN